MDWQAGAIQGVLFQHQPHGLPDALQIWTRVFGTSPQSFNQAPPGAPPVSQVAGVAGLYQAIIITQPGRIEITLSSMPSQIDAMPLIEDVDAGLAALKGYILKVVDVQPMARLATILHLVKRKGDAQGSAEEVRNAAKLHHIPVDATDVEIMLNVRRPLRAVPDIRMNRLCKWSAQLQQLVQVQVRADGISMPMGGQELHFATWMIDVNTVQRTVPFASAEANAVFDELLDEAKRIKAGGYDVVVS